MFPSSGYFRGLDCPFYASGLCERPYCHYRHAKQSSEKDQTWIGKSTTINQKLNNQLGDTLLNDNEKELLIEKAAPLKEVDKPFPKSTYSSCTSNKDLTKLYTYKPQAGGTYDKANDSLDNSKYKPYTKYNCDGKSNYQPSCDNNQIKKGRYEEYTVSKKKEKKVSEYNCDIASNSVPEYNPTPISELKRMHRYSTQSTTHSDLEYDPVSNFDAGFKSKSFFNLLDDSYPPSNQSVGDVTSGQSTYKPTKIPSSDDEEHDLVIDAKFSDDESEEEVVSSRLSDQDSDDETRDSITAFSKNKADDSGYSVYGSNTSSSIRHKTNGDDSKDVSVSSNKHVKVDSKSSSNEKSNKTSKSTNDIKRQSSSETTDSNKYKTTLDDKNKAEKNKSSSPDKLAKKKKISESEKSSSSEKKSSSDKRTSSSTSSEKKSSSEKKVSSSPDKKSSSDKKVSSSSSSSSDKKTSGHSSSTSSRDQSSVKKDKKELSSKEKLAAEKLKKLKESKSISEKQVNGSSEKDRSLKEKEYRKLEIDRNSSATKDRTKDENRKHESSSSSSVKKSSSVKPGVEKKSIPQTKPDTNKVKSDPDRKKELERRKSESERKSDSDPKKLDAVRRKSESEIKKYELEKKKDSVSCKNSLYLKRKESDKKSSKEENVLEKVRQETLSAKSEKLQRLKELNERVEVWKANRTDHKVNSERDKIPEKVRKIESSKVSDFTKKKLTHSSSDSKKVSSSSVSNNAIEKSKKRERDSAGEISREHPTKVIKKENSERHRCSSSDEKNSKHKISNNTLSKQRHSGVIKDKKNRSISIDDLFGEESSEEEESSGALEQSGGDESTGLSDDDEMHVIFGDTDLSENDPYEECLRIFNESNAQLQQQRQQQQQQQSKAAELKKKEVVQLPDIQQEGKKRVAHAGAASRNTVDRLKRYGRPALARPTPAQVMQNRFLEKQKRLAAELELQKEKSLTSLQKERPLTNLQRDRPLTNLQRDRPLTNLQRDRPLTNLQRDRPLTNLQRDRPLSSLAARQAKINLLKQKMSVPSIGTPESCSYNSERTVVGTAAKFGNRTAHMPKKDVIMKRPTITAEYGSKITALVRQRYLNLIIDEYLKLMPSREEAIEMGSSDELEVYTNCSSKLGYLNKAIHLIKRLRGHSLIIKESTTDNQMIPSKIPTTFPETRKLEHLVTGRDLHDKLQAYVLTEAELQENHFPRPEGVGRAKFYLSDIARDPYLPSDERFCVRCAKTYRVNSSGRQVVEDECMYHWAKPVRKRLGNSFENRYRCCQGEPGSTGCEVAPKHVHYKNKFDGSSGYMSTSHRSMLEEGPGVFAMDCEMVYTTAGVELARVTVINSECNAVYDTLVKPDHEITDYNTRFSGIVESDMKGVTTTLIQVQAVLLHYFSSDTILIGHSLESDLMAVKLVHSTVIDTSVLFPHRAGRPFKRALKNLTLDYLNTAIQEGIGGHDSQEDAVAAMRLVHYRLHQDDTGTKHH